MSSKHIGADINFAYPTAEIAVMGAEGAINILHRDKSPEERAKAIEEYNENFANPYKAAEIGYVDEVIYPRQTRFKIIQALESCKNKRLNMPQRKHGNIPL
jgi:propionyl-CoA carboxylase beta chain